jgi:peptide/nickel transport system substrate-binding protein
MGTPLKLVDTCTLRAVRGGIIAALLACAVFASGCNGSSASAGSDDPGPPKRGGQIILGMDQEPPCINTWVVCGGMAAASNMTDPLFDSFLDTTPDGEKVPLMATEVPTTENGRVKVVGSGMEVTMGIKPEAHWSDGTPVTCDDMVFTWETMMNEKWLIGSRLGWDLVSAIDCPDPKLMVVKFKERYAPYLRIMGTTPLPKHVLAGKDFNKFFNDRIPVSSGPFVFDYWKRNVEYQIKRNDNYWNAGKEDLPYLDSIKYRFLKDTNTLKIQLRTGEVDWINAKPDSNLREELEAMPRAKFYSAPGEFWENFAFNLSKAPTDDANVRRAIAYSIDRQLLADSVLRKQIKPLQSTLLPELKDYFVPAWEQYTYDEAKVEEYMKAAGYTRDGQYWTKDGKPAEIEFRSTAGNALRLKVGQILQQALKKNGIKMNLQYEDPGVFFGQTTVQGSFNVAIWAWSSDTDPTQTTLFACDQVPTKENNFAGSNNYRYCNEDVSGWMKRADTEPDVAKRAQLVKDIQTQMAKDVPTLPIFQHPQTVAVTGRVQGAGTNPFGGMLWNIHEWWVSDQ